MFFSRPFFFCLFLTHSFFLFDSFSCRHFIFISIVVRRSWPWTKRFLYACTITFTYIVSISRRRTKKNSKLVVDKRFVSFYIHGARFWDIYCIIFCVIVIFGCWTCDWVNGQWKHFGLLNHYYSFFFRFLPIVTIAVQIFLCEMTPGQNKQDTAVRFSQPMHGQNTSKSLAVVGLLVKRN